MKKYQTYLAAALLSMVAPQMAQAMDFKNTSDHVSHVGIWRNMGTIIGGKTLSSRAGMCAHVTDLIYALKSTADDARYAGSPCYMWVKGDKRQDGQSTWRYFLESYASYTDKNDQLIEVSGEYAPEVGANDVLSTIESEILDITDSCEDKALDKHFSSFVSANASSKGDFVSIVNTKFNNYLGFLGGIPTNNILTPSVTETSSTYTVDVTGKDGAGNTGSTQTNTFAITNY